VGKASANFTAHPSELPYGQQRYNVRIPQAGESSVNFVATIRRPRSPAISPSGFELPDGFSLIIADDVDETGMPRRIRCTVDDSEMALVPGGGFIQGIDGQAREAAPAHAAFVDTFYMDIYEITVGQYQRFREANADKRPQPCLNESDPPDMPALGVSWQDALFYARWAGKELPTEAEWEKAARGDESFLYPWGNSRAIWGGRRVPGQIDPVGAFRNDRSVYGIYDLAGNAREWTADWFAEDAYVRAKTADGSPVRNPEGPTRPSVPNQRVVKGAGDQGWHAWARGGLSMRETIPSVGFRLVLRIPPAEAEAEETAASAQR
jgi:formylglycine-generating enzyme required for sulfatase activity